MSEWKAYTLGEICSLITDGKHGNCNDELCSGYYFLSAKDVYDGKLHYENARQITRLDFEETDRRTNLQPGDLLITNSGTIGRIALTLDIPETRRTTFQKSVAILKPISDYLHERFFYYSIQGNCTGLIELAEGTTQQNLLLGELRKFTIKVPSLPEQRAITSVLSSLDDKIDLLHRQNKTLEAMAETLFRQWFVEEADEEWEEGVLGDVIELVYGKGLKQEVRTGKGYPVVGSSGIVGYNSDFLVKGPGIVIGRKGTLGKVIYLFENFFPIDTTYYIKSKIESDGLLYEYFLLKTLNFEEMNSDSAVPGLNRDIALSTEIQIAPLDKLHKFNKLASAFITKLSANSNNIRTLEKLRDTLLPKLMSGEVGVKYER